jgi:hypothetical protein
MFEPLFAWLITVEPSIEQPRLGRIIDTTRKAWRELQR